MQDLGLTVGLVLSLALGGCRASTAVDAGAAQPPATDAGARAPVYGGDVAAVQAKVGEAFTVALPGNQTTPYEWVVEIAPAPAPVEAAGEEYRADPPPDCRDCAGYGGTQSFTFRAVRAGQTELRFRYVHVAKRGAEPTKTRAIAVRVDP